MMPKKVSRLMIMIIRFAFLLNQAFSNVFIYFRKNISCVLSSVPVVISVPYTKKEIEKKLLD